MSCAMTELTFDGIDMARNKVDLTKMCSAMRKTVDIWQYVWKEGIFIKDTLTFKYSYIPETSCTH